MSDTDIEVYPRNPWIPKLYYEAVNWRKDEEEKINQGGNVSKYTAKKQGATGSNLKVKQYRQLVDALEQVICARFLLWGLNRRFLSLQWPWCPVGCSHPMQTVCSDVLVLCMAREDISVPMMVMEIESTSVNAGDNYVKDMIALLGSIQASKEGSAILIDSHGYGCFDVKRTAEREMLDITGLTGIFPGLIGITDATVKQSRSDLTQPPVKSPSGSNVSVTGAAAKSHDRLVNKYRKNTPLADDRNGPRRSFGRSLRDIFNLTLHRIMRSSAQKPETAVIMESMSNHSFEFLGEPRGYKHCIPPCVFTPVSNRAEREADYRAEMALKASSTVSSLAPSDSASNDDPERDARGKAAGSQTSSGRGEKKKKHTADREARLRRLNSNTQKSWFSETALGFKSDGKGGSPAWYRDDMKECCHLYFDVLDAIDRGVEEAFTLCGLSFTPNYVGYGDDTDEAGNARPAVDAFPFFVNPDNPYKNRDVNDETTEEPVRGSMPARPKFPWFHQAWNPGNWAITCVGSLHMKRITHDDVQKNKDRNKVTLFDVVNPKVIPDG